SIGLILITSRRVSQDGKRDAPHYFRQLALSGKTN
ncbi:hypothetical protein AZZ66_000251, partial [Escherichia coli]